MADVSPNRMKDSDFTFSVLVLDTVKELRDAHSGGDTDEAFKYCQWLFWLLKNHIPEQDAITIEKDWWTTFNTIDRIENAPDDVIRPEAKVSQIKKLKELFITMHMNYIMLAFPRAGITKVVEEGVITFDKEVDYEETKQIIRKHKSYVSVGKMEMQNNESTNAKETVSA